jgi:hypothetical protein
LIDKSISVFQVEFRAVSREFGDKFNASSCGIDNVFAHSGFPGRNDFRVKEEVCDFAATIGISSDNGNPLFVKSTKEKMARFRPQPNVYSSYIGSQWS